MRPVGDQILVEVVDEKGVLVTVNSMYGIAKVISKPEMRDSTSAGVLDDVWRSIQPGDELLVLALENYIINGKKYCFVNLRDIMAIL